MIKSNVKHSDSRKIIMIIDDDRLIDYLLNRTLTMILK